MRRNYKLLRLILEYVIDYGELGEPLNHPQFREFPAPDVAYHILLLSQAGYLTIHDQSGFGNPVHFKIVHLTWEGHEFLQGLRGQISLV